MGGLSIWHWLIVLVIVLLIFGTKKLRNIGEDLGSTVKGFKEGLTDFPVENKHADLAPNPVFGGLIGEGAIAEKAKS